MPIFQVFIKQQAHQPIAVAPRHVMNNAQPPTPTATTAPNLINGYNNTMMRWPVTTGATVGSGGQVTMVTAHQPPKQQLDSYPTPSPDSWGSLSTSSPLSAHDWNANNGYDNNNGMIIVNNNGQGGQQHHQQNIMMLSPPGVTTLEAPPQSNPRFQPSSTQQAVFI